MNPEIVKLKKAIDVLTKLRKQALSLCAESLASCNPDEYLCTELAKDYALEVSALDIAIDTINKNYINLQQS